MMILARQAFIKLCRHNVIFCRVGVRIARGTLAIPHEPMFKDSLAKHCPSSWIMSNA